MTFYNEHNPFVEKKNILDIAALNKERQKLVDVRRVTIYMGENIYLAMKWATKQQEFNLIQIKRIDSNLEFINEYLH